MIRSVEQRASLTRGAGLLALALGVLAAAGRAEAVDKKDPASVVIIYLGGPDAGGEGKKLIDQLIDHLGGTMGLEPGALQGSYFTENGPAVEHLKAKKDAFVLGSLGLYLAQHKALKLSPLARLKTTEDGSERFHVVVKKGQYASLDDLKGKTLWGSPLYEDSTFLNAIVFGGKLEAAKHFALKPTNRPLTAVRKLERDEADAVLLNSVQYESLRRLPLFEKLQEIYVSDPLPALGVMMVEGPKTRALRDTFLKTILGLCGSEKGKSVCANFGIAGFEPVADAMLEKVGKQYDSAGK